MITDKDYKALKKWLIILLAWSIWCIIGLFFVSFIKAFAIWILGIGVVMLVKKEEYRLWYNRVFNTNY